MLDLTYCGFVGNKGICYIEITGYSLIPYEPPLSLGGAAIQIRFWLMWVAVKIIVPFWVSIIIRHLIFRVPKKGP